MFILEVMAYWYDVCIQAFKVYALSAIIKHGNLLGWQQNKIQHSSRQTTGNHSLSLMEANAKLFNFFKGTCSHHDDLNYVHQVVVCHK